ncbi:MAG: hypothetical protein MUO26_08060 [Methanotrichaceae archaeon]|nr:hypothetical protein [Methanotrichaceae archaeon]
MKGVSGKFYGEGFCWLETFNPDFTNWYEAEKNLPKGTILGLKHSENQPDIMVIWRGQIYDPVESYKHGDYSPPPPIFIAKHGGDLGADEGQGFYWYEKETGPDIMPQLSFQTEN